MVFGGLMHWVVFLRRSLWISRCGRLVLLRLRFGVERGRWVRRITIDVHEFHDVVYDLEEDGPDGD